MRFGDVSIRSCPENRYRGTFVQNVLDCWEGNIDRSYFEGAANYFLCILVFISRSRRISASPGNREAGRGEAIELKGLKVGFSQRGSYILRL